MTDDITPEKVRILQQADNIYITTLREHGWYDKIWQAGAIFLPVKSVKIINRPDPISIEPSYLFKRIYYSKGCNKIIMS